MPARVKAGLVIVGELSGDALSPAAVGAPRAFASPKSSTLTWPSGVSLMFAGLRSRCSTPLLVRVVQRLDELLRDWQCVLDGHRAAGDAVGQRRALDQLHHEGTHAIAVLESVDGGDVLMRQRGEDFRLALEPGHAIRVGGQRVGQYLERHVAFEPGIAGAIHLAHAALPEHTEHVEGAEPRAGADTQIAAILTFRTRSGATLRHPEA